MATPNQPTDPAQLGADQSPETSPRDDSRDMSPVIAETDKDQSPDTASQPGDRPLGSDFDQQRRQGAEGHGNPTGDTGQGLGRADYDGDEDRTYDQTPQRGGLGSSGGREDHADRNTGPRCQPLHRRLRRGRHQPTQPRANQKPGPKHPRPDRPAVKCGTGPSPVLRVLGGTYRNKKPQLPEWRPGLFSAAMFSKQLAITMLPRPIGSATPTPAAPAAQVAADCHSSRPPQLAANKGAKGAENNYQPPRP